MTKTAPHVLAPTPQQQPTPLREALETGIGLHRAGRLDDAEAVYRQITNAFPREHNALCFLGVIAFQRGDHRKAIELLEQSLSIKPRNAIAHNNLGAAWAAVGEAEKSIRHYHKATRIEPGDFVAYGNLGDALMLAGKAEEAVASYRRALKLKPDNFVRRGNLIYALNHDPHATPRALFEEAARYGMSLSKTVKPISLDALQRRAGAPLRVGFVSADLRRHAVATFLVAVLEAIDKKKISLFAYSNSAINDDITEQLRPSFAAWRPIKGMSDDAVARRVIDDEIDILVDLSGHTKGGRLPLFARKPAPVQAAWLGYSGTTGLDAIDYFVCGPSDFPKEEEPYFTEKPVRLPDARFCFTPPDAEIAVGPPPAVKNGYVTFGVFQRRSKINSEVIRCFARVLRQIPGSRLAFRGRGFEFASSQAETRSAFKSLEIGADRIDFLKFVSREAYLESYNAIDIALSPFPWPGLTTSFEGLWMGVPMIMRRCHRYTPRSGEAILSNLDMTDWLAEDDRHYSAIAAAKAADIDALAQLRAGLRRRLLSSPLCDAPRFARHLEEAFWAMQRRLGEAGGASDSKSVND